MGVAIEAVAALGLRALKTVAPARTVVALETFSSASTNLFSKAETRPPRGRGPGFGLELTPKS